MNEEKLTPAETLVANFQRREIRSKGTQSEWYWREAANTAARLLGVDRQKVQRHLLQGDRDPKENTSG